MAMKILLAEDNEINRKLFSIMIIKMGHELDIAVNGLEAVKLASENTYDLVFMDLHMPEMNGFEASKIIKKDFPGLIIIAVTAETADKTLKMCKEAGIDDILKKPYKKEDVFQVVIKYST